MEKCLTLGLLPTASGALSHSSPRLSRDCRLAPTTSECWDITISWNYSKGSLPGAGPTLAARMLAEIADSRERYCDYQAVLCEAGTAPVTVASSNYSYVRFKRGSKKPLPATLHQFAFCSRRESD